VVVLAFGFTQCTKVCPVTLSKLAALTQKLGTASSDVQVVYVTVDPERDTAERLRAYLQAFDKSFVGGTGTAAQLDVVRHDYGILAKKVALAGGATYEVHHSSFLYLVDREGKLRVLVPFGKTIEDIHNDVQLLLKG
jgi:protein SCO1/2